MIGYKGDFPINFANLTLTFDSFAAATGAPSATSNFANTDVQIYKNGGTTQRSSASGITVSTSFDSQTGLQMIIIDLSDNTDAGFYAAGNEYDVAIADVTIDGQTVRFWVGSFSIQRAGGVLALLKAGTAKVDVDTIKTNPVVNGGTVTFPTNKTIADTSLLPTALTANGNMKSSLVEILTTALTETAGLLAGGFKKLFNVASPTGTLNSIPDAVPGAANGLPTTNGTKINQTVDLTAGQSVGVSGDFSATMKTSLNAATPASVVGAVGSVTGSIGSVGTGGISSSSYAANAIDSAALAASAAQEIADTMLARALAAESYAANGAVPTLSQMLYMLWSVLAQFGITTTTISCKKLDGSTEAMTFTLDSASAPTSRVRAT